MNRLEELRVAAEAATPGPWETSQMPDGNGVVYVALDGHDAVSALFDADWGTPEDASFIAQANPETVLALIALVEELSAALVRTSIFTPVGRVETRRLARAALASAATWMED